MYQYPIRPDELRHYGIIGMKWGRRRFQNPDGSLTAAGKARIAKVQAENTRLEKKATKKDRKADTWYKRSERVHAKKDLKRANRSARKSAKYAIKADEIRKQKAMQNDPAKKVSMERRAQKYTLKSQKQHIKAERISKQSPYSKRALKYAIRSEKFKAQAERARYKLAKNNMYIEALRTPVARINRRTV